MDHLELIILILIIINVQFQYNLMDLIIVVALEEKSNIII